MADLRDFYASHLTRNNVTVGIAGGYPPDFLNRMKADFAKLPVETGLRPVATGQRPVSTGSRVLLIQKDTRSVAFSLGFPIDVKRGDPDFPALLVVQSYFGQHRMSGGRLYQRMRELRGLNYGDYAYIEYFPRGMYLSEPSPISPGMSRSSRSGYARWSRPRPTSRCAWLCSS